MWGAECSTEVRHDVRRFCLSKCMNLTPKLGHLTFTDQTCSSGLVGQWV